MQPDIKTRILDAKIACDKVMEFTKGLSYESFNQSALITSAVERQLEIIGESLNRASALDHSLANKVPDIPKIIGLRNRLIHGYDVVDDHLIWDIISTKIKPLRDKLEMLLNS
jgi:hypothetical protein